VEFAIAEHEERTPRCGQAFAFAYIVRTPSCNCICIDEGQLMRCDKYDAPAPPEDNLLDAGGDDVSSMTRQRGG
jgi:hypothetical protein